MSPSSSLQLAFEILAKDHASKQFDKVGDSADKAGKKGAAFGKVIGGAVAAGVALFGATLKVGFGEVKDYQAGLAQLQAGIKSTGNVAGVSTKGLEDLASSIQGYSGQTDDSIVASEKLLLTFTNIRNSAGKNNDIFNQATKATADLAARMGGDASANAIKLGKALNDPVKGVTALQKIGISFSESQKATIAAMVKTGDVAGAQKVILAELNKEVGGSAEAYGKTLPGQIDRSKRSFEDVSQSLVTALLPVITKLLDVVNTQFIPAFKSTVDFMTKNKAIIVPLAAAFGGLAAAVYIITTAAKAYAAVQAALNIVLAANPIGLVVLAVAALAAGLIIAWKNSETFRSVVIGAFKGIAGVVLGTIEGMLKAVGFFAKGSDLVFGTHFGKTIKNAIAAVEALNNKIQHIGDKTVKINLVLAAGGNGAVVQGRGGKFGLDVNPAKAPSGFVPGHRLPPALAEGGIVRAQPGGRLVRVAEAGRDEAVIPLSKGGGGALRLHLADLDYLADRLAGTLNGTARLSSSTARARAAH